MKNRSILVLTNTITGLYSFRREVMKALVDAGYHVILSVPDADSPKVQPFKEMGCEAIQTSFNRTGMNPLADIRLLWTYVRMIRKYKPLAVLTYTIKPNVYGGMACRLCGVAQLANVTGLGDAMENGGWLQKLTVALYKVGVGRACRVFFQNSSNRETCIKLGIAKEDAILLPGSGVNLLYHTVKPYPKENDRIKFLFIGRMKRDKGIEEYFSAAEVIRARFPNTEFQILGYVEGDYQERLDGLVARGVVHFLGRTPDVRPYIEAVHCTIMPSYHEGMSNVNLESAAAGRPVITTDVPGCRETVDDGITGILVDARSSESLVSGIERFMALSDAQKQQMGLAARQKVEREFDRQIVVDAYLNEINRICE